MTSDHLQPPIISADAAMQRLIEGNNRFLQGKARFPTVCRETLADLARGQQPYATILGCSDSRVPPELIFDANFGELFIIRVDGNVISPEVMGSMQYAGAHLHTPLFVVLGHEGCGAVKAAVDSKLDAVEHQSRIQILVDNSSGSARIRSAGCTTRAACTSCRSQREMVNPPIAGNT
jgi:carbonic anhydrase